MPLLFPYANLGCNKIAISTFKFKTMKKLMIAALLLAGFSTAGIAQVTTPAPKKGDASKLQVVKKTTDQKEAGKVVKMNTPVKPAVAPVTKPVTTTPLKKEAANAVAKGPAKKDGTPDMRYKSNQAKTSGPLKKDGTKDMRYKENKKHS